MGFLLHLHLHRHRRRILRNRTAPRKRPSRPPSRHRDPRIPSRTFRRSNEPGGSHWTNSTWGSPSPSPTSPPPDRRRADRGAKEYGDGGHAGKPAASSAADADRREATVYANHSPMARRADSGAGSPPGESLPGNGGTLMAVATPRRPDRAATDAIRSGPRHGCDPPSEPVAPRESLLGRRSGHPRPRMNV